MKLEGLNSLFPMEELSVMGFFKPLLRYFRLKVLVAKEVDLNSFVEKNGSAYQTHSVHST